MKLRSHLYKARHLIENFFAKLKQFRAIATRCHNYSACGPASLPADPSNIDEMLKILLVAEQCAVRGYSHICDLTAGKDHRTYDFC